MENKRGQGLSTTAIILIVLGVVVLVVLILGFTIGWSKLAPWMSSDNLDEIAQTCQVACSTNSEYDFCFKGREVVLEDNEDYTSLGLNKDNTYSCSQLSEKGGTGVEGCNSLTCEVTESKITELRDACTGSGKSWGLVEDEAGVSCTVYTYSRKTYYCCETA